MKKRMMIGARMYERMQMYTFNEIGKQAALKDAQAWRESGYWATVRKGIETTYSYYPQEVTGPVWATYKSIKKKGK